MNQAFRKMNLVVTLLAAGFMASSPSCFSASSYDEAQDVSLESQGEPLIDEFGRQMFTIYLDEELAEREDATNEEPMRLAADPRNAKEWRGWHRPPVRAMIKRLEGEYGIEAISMTSHLLPTFSSYLSSDEVRKIESDERVVKIEPVIRDGTQFSAWTDLPGGGNEIIPWGKIAIGTNDGQTTTNTVYMIDGDEQSHVDLVNIEVAPVNPTYNIAPEHANHVAGILSARANNDYAVRGVNPSSKVISVHRGTSTSEIQSAMDWVYMDSEQRNIFSVVNFSSNSSPSTPSGIYSPTGTYGPFIKRLSARALFVQSAGNSRENACLRAWNTPIANDGILVVGGIDENGAQAINFDNSGSGYGSSSGSNFGSCIEVWAPSQRIWSTWSPSTTSRQTLSGTSMAAPHVTAFAARFGNNTTTPVQREYYVNSKLVPTGYADDQGYAIRIPSLSHNSPPVPNLLSPLGIYASSTLPGSSTSYLIDKKYADPSKVWNSGGPAPAWVEFDLGTPHSIKTIRLTPEQTPVTGMMTHRIYVGDGPSPATLVATISGNLSSREPIIRNISVTGRYVRIHTTTSASWVAWREIEVYGF